MNDLDTLVELSREFGSADFVKGGGGNTSVKNGTTLWIKPSGSALAGLTGEKFTAMNRLKINQLYHTEMPAEADAREERVKDMMAAAVENDAGRPSVEAPLHNVFGAKFVVHTHPAIVNGLTCAKDGEAACDRLFPEALWVEYIDPGYTLCVEVRKRIEACSAAAGREPSLLMLQNHGIFIAADTADEIRARYKHVMDGLIAEYSKAGISLDLAVGESPSDPEVERRMRGVFGDDAAFAAAGGKFSVVPGPITPDHLVYARAFPYAGGLTEEEFGRYKAERGYSPRVVVIDDIVYGIGRSQKSADLALEMAQDGALVMQLAEAFGGIRYMTDAQREFIENWEVESYRSEQVT